MVALSSWRRRQQPARGPALYAVGVFQFASALASASASAIGFIGGGYGAPEDLIAGNDASLDVSAFSLEAAADGTVVSATSSQVDVLGTDGLTYRFFGSNFSTFSATNRTHLAGGDITLIEVWAGFGEFATFFTAIISIPTGWARSCSMISISVNDCAATARLSVLRTTMPCSALMATMFLLAGKAMTTSTAESGRMKFGAVLAMIHSKATRASTPSSSRPSPIWTAISSSISKAATKSTSVRLPV